MLHRTEKREKRREQKAELAARVDSFIEAEKLKQLQAGTYADIYNFPLKQYEKVRDAVLLVQRLGSIKSELLK